MVKKILLIGLVIVALIAAYVWFFEYNKPHENIEEAKAEYTFTVPEVVSEYSGDFNKANTTYNGKVVEITGEIDRVIPNDSISSIVFKSDNDYEIYCEVYPINNEEALKLAPSEKVTVKGFVSGAEAPDEMLEIGGVIRMKKCSFKK